MATLQAITTLLSKSAKFTPQAQARLVEIANTYKKLDALVDNIDDEETLPITQALLDELTQVASATTDNVLNAVGGEYDYGLFRYRAVEVIAMDERNIQIERYGTNIRVHFDPYQTIDRARDYLQAVQVINLQHEAKKIMRATASSNSIRTKSRYWRDYVYKPAREGAIKESSLHRSKPTKKTGRVLKEEDRERELKFKYSQIIEDRLDLSDGWYELLDLGYTAGGSGRGGTPYPVQPPTHIVMKIESAMQEVLNLKLAHARRRDKAISSELGRFYKELRAATHSMGRLDVGDVVARLTLANEQIELYIRESETYGRRLGARVTRRR